MFDLALRNSRILVFLSILFIVCSGFASGMHMPGVGSKGVSMGCAFRASCDDASAIYWNPAGLSLMPDSISNSIYLNAQLIMNDFRYTPSDTLLAIANIIRDDESAMTSPLFLLPHLFSSHRFPKLKNWNFGLGVYAPFGVASTWDVLKDDDLDYVMSVNGRELFVLLPDSMFELTLTEELPEEDFAGRIRAYTISPTVSYSPIDWFSIGASFIYTYSTFEVAMPIIDSVRMASDTGVVFQEVEMSGGSYGINAGFLAHIRKNLRFAGTFRAESPIKYSGDYRHKLYKFHNQYLSDLLGGSVLAGGYSEIPWVEANAELKRPLQIGTGLAWDATSKLIIEFDYSWTGWSVIDTLEVILESPESTVVSLPMHWTDTHKFAIGAQYKINQNYAVRAGIFNEPHPPIEEYQNLFIPDFQDKIAMTFGAGGKWGSIAADASVEMQIFGSKTYEPNYEDSSIPVNIPGEYKGYISAFTLGLTYNF